MAKAKAGEGKRINKMEAMRQTVAKLGKDASAKAIQKYLKKKFNADMSIDMVYTYKGTAIKQLAAGKKGKRRGRKPGKATAAKPAGAVSMADIEAVKAVVDRIGGKKVQQLAAVLE